MSTKSDLSDLSIEELDALIADATSARQKKVDARRAELLAELERLGGVPSGLSAVGESKERGARTRGAAPVTHQGPAGEVWRNRGFVPKWAAKYGVTTKEGMEKFKVSNSV